MWEHQTCKRKLDYHEQSAERFDKLEDDVAVMGFEIDNLKGKVAKLEM